MREQPSSLAPREIEIAGLACEGLTCRQIAVELYLSVNTVRNHVQRVYGKLAVHNRLEMEHEPKRLAHEPGRRAARVLHTLALTFLTSVLAGDWPVG